MRPCFASALACLLLLAGGATTAQAALPPEKGEFCTWKFAGFFEVRVKTATESFLCDFDPLREAVHDEWKTSYCRAGNRVVQLRRRNLPGVHNPSCRVL